MADQAPGLGTRARKVDPMLRMVANGSASVNLARAEQSATIAIDGEHISKRALRGHQLAAERAVLTSKADLPTPALPRIAPGVTASVFIQTTSPDERVRIEGETARRGDLVLAELPLDRLERVLEQPAVTYVQAGEALRRPRPRVEMASSDAPAAGDRDIGLADRHAHGAGVLIGIIDVDGFDFSHPDFADGHGGTRFERIWDQGGDTRPSPSSADPSLGSEFAYGSELRKEHLDAAMAAAPAAGVDPWDLEPQSQMLAGSHGTHVASIAAGNAGVARKAAIAAVLISLPDDDVERRSSFADSSRIAHAVDYLLKVAGDRPVSINISLGTNGHAHDGSSPVNRWIDRALTVPGRSVTIAAGNAGQEAPQAADDIGYILGRIHTSGRVPSAGLDVVLDWIVIGEAFDERLMDVSENEFELWYGPQDRFAVTLRTPDGVTIGPLFPGEYLENEQLADGSFVSIYSELYHPANGANYIAIYLSPYYGGDRTAGVARGTWQVRLTGLDVRDGRFHAWIERDDLMRVRGFEFRFPSFFGERSNVDDTAVSSLACGQDSISVANLDEVLERINVTSSQGPTRDGRQKPDVAAPGTGIVAASGFTGPEAPWLALTGTSMASPYVAGVVALMLAVESSLTAAQIEGIIQRTARPLPAHDYAWVNDAGFGRIDPRAAIEEAGRVNARQPWQRP